MWSRLPEFSFWNSPHFSLRFSFEFESVSVVDEAVEDGVRECRISDPGVPVFNRQLGCDEGGLLLVAVVQDFEKIPFSVWIK